MTPAERLAATLADARRAGDDFDTAWTPAVDRVLANATGSTRDLRDWRAALEGTRWAWRSVARSTTTS